MSKKLILLMLALPLLIMLSLFTATSTVSLAVSVPVSKIEITSDPVVYLDLDEAETYAVDYTIYPTNAANKNVTFSTEKIGEEPLAELEYNEGIITPKTCGKALVYLTTVDGGFKDSFIIQVDSQSLQAIAATVSDAVIDVGGTATITTEFTPLNAPNKQLRYEIIEGDGVISVNAQGLVTGLDVGVATVKVISRMNEAICTEVSIEVKSSAAMQLVEDKVTTTTKQTGGSIKLFIDSEVAAVPTIEVLDADGNATDSVISYTIDTVNKVLNYTYLDTEFEGRLTLKLTVNVEGLDPYVDSCTLIRINQMQAHWLDGDGVTIIELGATKYVAFEWVPADIEVECTSNLSNDYISIEVDLATGMLKVVANKLGPTAEESNTFVTLTLTDKNNPDSKVVLVKTIAIYSF